jgi:hypothetical protein
MYWISKMSFLYGYSCERYKQNTLVFSHIKILIRPFLVFFFLPFWRAVRSYWPHLDIRDPIWGDDRSHRLLLSPSWYFPGFSWVVREMRGELCTAPGIIIITLIISRQMWLTWHSGKWALVTNPERNMWYQHTGVKIFLAASHGSMDSVLKLLVDLKKRHLF